MNPLVEKMLNTTVSNDVETRFLEDLFEQDCECESRHDIQGDTCSGEVTHILRTHLLAKRMCIVAATRVQGKITSLLRCNCGLFCSECWTITPI